MLSCVLDKVYNKTPRIHNELINRDKPSAQANAARNKLLYAMQNNPTEADLAIDKFPAEKAMYRAVLRQAGLHQLMEDNITWHLCAPSTDGRKDKANIRHVWKRIDEFLDSTEKEAKSFADLNAVLLAPPYGVKAGLLPILYMSAYMVYQHEIALYEQRRYRPYFTEEMLDRFVKRPDEFRFSALKSAGYVLQYLNSTQKSFMATVRNARCLSLLSPLLYLWVIFLNTLRRQGRGYLQTL